MFSFTSRKSASLRAARCSQSDDMTTARNVSEKGIRRPTCGRRRRRRDCWPRRRLLSQTCWRDPSVRGRAEPEVGPICHGWGQKEGEPHMALLSRAPYLTP